MQAKNRVLHIFKSVYGSGFELDAVVLWSRSVRPTLSFECTDGQRLQVGSRTHLSRRSQADILNIVREEKLTARKENLEWHHL